jgi:effector-binding domain-containing protein
MKKGGDMKMEEVPEEIVKWAASGEVKAKTTKPQEVVYVVHKGSYQKLGEVFGRLAQWLGEMVILRKKYKVVMKK